MIAKYFWDLKGEALKETRRILKDPAHPKFPQRMTVLLTRCSRPKELFRVIPRERFVQAWPRVREYWIKRQRRSDSRDWWETLYEQLMAGESPQPARVEGTPPAFLQDLGAHLKEARMERGLSQKQLGLRVGLKQPDISRIEEGKKNITLFTLVRLCRTLGIRTLALPGEPS